MDGESVHEAGGGDQGEQLWAREDKLSLGLVESDMFMDIWVEIWIADQLGWKQI